MLWILLNSKTTFVSYVLTCNNANKIKILKLVITYVFHISTCVYTYMIICMQRLLSKSRYLLHTYAEKRMLLLLILANSLT